MQIKEILSLYINDSSGILDVTFRTFDDDENVVRIDEIELEESKVFGYDFTENITENIYEDIDDELDFLFEDEDENHKNTEKTISFLEEYYLLYPDRIPPASEY